MSYIGAQPTTGSFPFDQFSGNGSTTAFTLTYAPASTSSIIVAVSGVVQNPNTYSCISTTLTFTGAPPTGTNNISVLYLGLPVIGVASPGNTAYFSSTSFTATASQTTFTPSGSYTVGFINVIRNGAQLAPANYTATNGTTVVLANACTAGDIVVIEVYTLTSIANAIPQNGGTFTGGVSGTTFTGTTFTGTSFVTPTGTLYPLVSGTAVASTSGTSIDFTGIPSTAKRITVMFQSLSTNSTSNYVIRIGNTTVTATGYVSTMTYVNTTSNSSVGLTDTTGYLLTRDISAGTSFTGIMTICLLSNFVYVASFNASTTGSTFQGSGFLNLGSVLDRVRLTTINGTDTFDAGSINIMWE
jgi:hypothetical protein